ncbi:MAG: MFS transporter [Acidobacteria bacterium]|nr:MAG: MFS transporter [Acidobacteriota bacterium]
MQAENNSGKLSVIEKVGFGLGDTASNILYQAWSFFLAIFYTDVFMLPTGIASYLFLATRVWDMVFDPTIGMIADRTHSRWGKFRPYLLWLAIPYGALAWAMFITPNWGLNARIIYAFVTYILATTAYTAINIPYSSLMAVMTPSPKERTSLSRYRFLFAFLGMLIITTFTLPLARLLGADPSHPGYNKDLGYSQALGFQMTMAIFGAIAVLLLFVTFFTTRERVLPPEGQASSFRQDLKDLSRNGPWIILFISAIFFLVHNAIRNASVLYYFDYVNGHGKDILLSAALGPMTLDFSRSTAFLTIGTFGMIAGVLLTYPLTKSFGKKPLIIFFTLASVVLEMSFYFLPPSNFVLLSSVNFAWSILAGGMPVFLFAMYSDVADYYEWKFRRRATGLVISGIMFAIKAGIAVGGFLTLKLLDIFEYVPNQPQTEGSITGIKLMFSIIPGIFALICGLVLVFYPINEEMLQNIEQDLKEGRRSRMDRIELDPVHPADSAV